MEEVIEHSNEKDKNQLRSLECNWPLSACIQTANDSATRDDSRKALSEVLGDRDMNCLAGFTRGSGGATLPQLFRNLTRGGGKCIACEGTGK